MAENPSEDAQARLTVMEKESNGFRIAEEDLNLRGPGELTGTRQSGLPDMKLASLADIDLLSAARSEANDLLIRDEHLELPENNLLSEALDRLVSKVEKEEVEQFAKKLSPRKR